MITTAKITGAILLGILLCPAVLCAQKQQKNRQVDSLAAIRDFLSACNVYKQLPLQLSVRIRNTANIVTSKEDTAGIDAFFYLDAHSAYTDFGELEQLVNDSLVLVVSREAKRMMLFANTPALAARMRQSMGLQQADSSALKMAAKYTAAVPQNGIITLSSRASLYGASLPKETIRLLYDTASRVPVEVIYTRRALLSVDATVYERYAAMPGWEGKLLSLGKDGYFLIKEQAATYTYEKVSHDSAAGLPVHLYDRIVQAPGGYQPVKGYESFILNRNL